MNKSISLGIVVMSFLLACQSPISIKNTDSNMIRLNQIGYYPGSVKQFIVADLPAAKFDLINEENEVVFSSDLSKSGTWDISGEAVMLGDFSSFQKTGTYRILVDDETASYSFKIESAIYKEVLNAAIKSYYFQRASMAIEGVYGGIYKRAAGHVDDNCIYHISTGKTQGSLNAPGGWYDAGDYGKYIVNASLSTSQMLHLIEQYPVAIEDGVLNIPESGNGINDLWDELKYELDWILTMQDDDGAVFHKITALGFSGFIMPESYDLQRYVIGKGTAASLNFAAVLAQASRLYSHIDAEWSQTTLSASKRAWEWAVSNNSIAYTNPSDVNTGQYGDDKFLDDFYWAAAELYITTKEEVYLNHLNLNQQEYQHELTNSWKFFIRNMGFHSLLENREEIKGELANSLTKGHLDLADDILKKIETNPYRIALERFEWGSNSDILNQAMILCIAHRISGKEKYLIGAEQINDYIFGKNATGYSFITGFGSKQVMNPHHRQSGADAIEYPVPGFILGGPNAHKQDSKEVTYNSKFPAKSYMDVEASYASNEVCLNWNAPAVYVLGYLEQNRK